jgi:hypothetical protein
VPPAKEKNMKPKTGLRKPPPLELPGMTARDKPTEAAKDKAVDTCRHCQQPIVPTLKDAIPIVLYFKTRADADEFIALIQEAKPGLVARRLK